MGLSVAPAHVAVSSQPANLPSVGLPATSVQGFETSISGSDQPTTTIVEHSALGVRAKDLSESLLKYAGHLRGCRATILIDGGSTGNFVSEAFVHRHELRKIPLDDATYVTVANGSREALQFQTELLKLGIQGYHQRVCLTVLPNMEYDVILGKPWLACHAPHINYRTNVVTFTFAGREHKFIPDPVTLHSDEFMASKLLTCAQVQKAVNSGADVLLVSVHPMEPDIPVAVGTNHSNMQLPIVQEFSDVFPEDLPVGLPPSRSVNHRIVVEEGSVPPNLPTYRMSFAELDELKKQLTELQEKQFIQPSQSPYGSPILFVRKKDGTMRMCVDYRALNKITVKNSYPLPRIEELLDRMQGAHVFSKLDLRSGYHQIRMHDEDIPKTAFHTRYGHFEYRVLPFGLTNAPATFQFLMHNVFNDMLDQCVVVYLDDIVVYSKNAAEHEVHLREVLQRLRKHTLYAKLSKCEFFKDEIEFCGQLVGANGVAMEPSKVASMVNFPVPTSLTQLRSFLGLCNFYRKFVRGYAKIAGPLHNLTKSSVAWRWGAEEQQAFEGLRHAMTTSPVLALPDPDLPFTVCTDASAFAIGAVLSQDQGRGPQPVGFISHTLSPQERNWPTHDREMHALIYALTSWRHYLQGRLPFVAYTDHQALRHFGTQPKLSSKQIRWMGRIQQFPCQIAYLPGKDNVVADALSRRPDLDGRGGEEPPPPPLNFVPVAAADFDRHYGRQPAAAATSVDAQPAAPPASRIRVQRVAAIQSARVQLSARTQAVVKRGYTEDPVAVKLVELTCSDAGHPPYLWADDHLWYLASSDDVAVPVERRLYVPDVAELRATLLSEHHDPACAGHLGRDKTLEALSRQFFWPGMARDVAEYVSTCRECQAVKASSARPAGLLQPLPPVANKWEWITMDFITALPTSTSGHDSILTIVDRCTKFAYFIPTTTTVDAPETAQLFLHHVFCHHGLPKIITSDRDTRFLSKFWNAVMKGLGTQLRHSTAFHPQTDGQSERANRTVEDMLRCTCQDMPKNWDKQLPLVQFAYNNSKSPSTGYTPFYLMSGCHPVTPASLLVPAVAPAVSVSAAAGGESAAAPAEVPAATAFLSRMDAALASATENLAKARERQRVNADRHRRHVKYEEGDEVMLSTENLQLAARSVQRKLAPRFIGPFRIEKVLTDTTVRLVLPASMKIHPVFHVSLLRLFKTSERFPSDQRPSRRRPAAVIVDGTPEFIVERFVAERTHHGRQQFLVKWRGYPLHDAEWLFAEDLQHDLDASTYRRLSRNLPQ